jgi:hypothetical protein
MWKKQDRTDSSEHGGGRTPSIAAMVFIALLAVGGLYGASRAGGGRFEFPARGARSVHLSHAHDYRLKAATSDHEAELYRSMLAGTGAAKGEVLPEELRVRCQHAAAAAAELSRLQSELAAYHERQAQLLDPITTRAP